MTKPRRRKRSSEGFLLPDVQTDAANVDNRITVAILAVETVCTCWEVGGAHSRFFDYLYITYEIRPK
jgi:hypothetical protein